MRSLRIVLPSFAVLELTPRHLLLLCAAVAAAGLLLTYVGLLNDAVARGAQWRVDHQTTASTHLAKAPRIPRATL
jgi:type II secretory pathway component PulM